MTRVRLRPAQTSRVTYLHHRVGAQDSRSEGEQTSAHLTEHTERVVNEDPTHAPARHEPLLGNAAHREHGHVTGEQCCGYKGIGFEHHATVDFIGNHGQVMFGCETANDTCQSAASTPSRIQNYVLENVAEVFARPDRAAGIGRIVDEQRTCLVIDLGLERGQICLPLVVGQQGVATGLNT